MTHLDRPMLGIALMLAFCAIIPVSDAIAKTLVNMIPLVVIVLARFIGQAAMSARSMLKQWRNISRRVLWLNLLRAIVQVLSTLMLYLSLRYMPLADAIAIFFVFPFIVLLLGRFFLGEQVGIRRTAACFVGFCGTLLVIQPSFVTVGAVALLPFFSSFAFALYTLMTRHMVMNTDPMLVQGLTGVCGTLVLFALAAVFGPYYADYQLSFHPGMTEIVLLMLIGLIGSGGHVLLTKALRYAPASMLSSVQYLEIPFATLTGWVVFQEFPNSLAGLGILIVIGAGLYIVYRERQLLRRAALAAKVEPAS